MYCQKCGIENLEEARFCRECGFQFGKDDTIKCSSCGNLNSQNTKFCGQCGKLLAGDRNMDSSAISYWFYLKPNPGFSKKTLFKLHINKKRVIEGLLKDGFNFRYEVRNGDDNYHLVEIEFIRKGFNTDVKLNDFSKKIKFDATNGELIEFEYLINLLPFTINYIRIKP